MQMLESVFVWLFPLNFYLQFLSFFQCLSSLLCVTLRLAGLASSSPAFSSNPSCLLINIWSQKLSFKIFFHIYVVVSLERKNGSCSRTLYSLCRGRLAHIELAKCSHKQGDTVLDASGSHQSGSFEEDELTQSSLKPDLKPDVQSKFSLSLSLFFIFNKMLPLLSWTDVTADGCITYVRLGAGATPLRCSHRPCSVTLWPSRDPASPRRGTTFNELSASLPGPTVTCRPVSTKQPAEAHVTLTWQLRPSAADLAKQSHSWEYSQDAGGRRIKCNKQDNREKAKARTRLLGEELY